MKVSLIGHTGSPEEIVAAAAFQCYAAAGAEQLLKDLDRKKASRRIRDCLSAGHHSVLEHASFTFAVEGISRVTSHQLVRHRLASYSQQSQRYVRMGAGGEYVVPPSIGKRPDLKARVEKLFRDASDLYSQLIESDIPPEDARYVVPSAAMTKIVLTMNARELLHFFSLRLCRKAQWEIRELAGLILKAVRPAAPELFKSAGPPCREGTCPEGDAACEKKMKSDRVKRGRP